MNGCKLLESIVVVSVSHCCGNCVRTTEKTVAKSGKTVEGIVWVVVFEGMEMEGRFVELVVWYYLRK